MLTSRGIRIDGNDGADAMLLPRQVQAALLDVAHRRRLSPGDSLFLKGSMPDALFGVVQGMLRVSVSGASGREAVIATLKSGHWFGETSLLVGRERVYDTFAMEPTEMAIVSAKDFHRLIASDFDIHLAFSRLVGMRLRQALNWIDDVILNPLPVRLAHRLLVLTDEAHSHGLASGDIGASQEDLSRMLGVSRQSVNRQLKMWEADGILRLEYKRIFLLDRDRLSRVAL
jgi:CRP-like cAMP-binding protein